MLVRSRAPLRLGLAGGGSDVSPYSDIYGGSVLNATINMYAYCTLEFVNDGNLEFHALDLNRSWKGKSEEQLPLEGELILHKAIYNYVVREFNKSEPLSLRVHTYSDAPPGCGLGSSSSMVVALVKAFQEFLKLPLGEYDLANLAYEIERVDCALAGGKQDQYAATFGGFNFMEFYADNRVIVNPLRIRDRIVNELESHLMLYFTGRSRESAKIIDEQTKATVNGDESSIQATHLVKEASYDMKEALLKSNLFHFADIMGQSWLAKQKMARSISNSYIEGIYTRAMKAGAIAAKISGAGGGGVLMLFVDPIKRVEVARSLDGEDGTFYPFHFTNQGAQGWVSRC